MACNVLQVASSPFVHRRAIFAAAPLAATPGKLADTLPIRNTMTAIVSDDIADGRHSIRIQGVIRETSLPHWGGRAEYSVVGYVLPVRGQVLPRQQRSICHVGLMVKCILILGGFDEP